MQSKIPKTVARFRVVTKHQISGWRFLFRRIEHALVRRDASMIDDPQRGRSTALSLGVALACVIIAGSAVLSFFKPAKQVGDSAIVAEKDTGALFVRIGPRLHPALNLTSARLIVGSPANPVLVSRDELAKYPRGPLVGIAGAPGSITDSGGRDSSWTVCDGVRTGTAAPVDPATGLPTVSRASLRTTAIGGPLTVDGEKVRPLADGEARLLRGGNTTWLVYPDRDHGVVRAAIDLGNSAVTLALGLDSTATMLQASAGLLGAIPEAPPIRVPEIPGAGQLTTLSSGLSVAVGSVLTVATVDRGTAYYLVSQSGVVQVGPVLAAMIRNADSYGSVTTNSVGPDVIAANLRPGSWPGTATYPTAQVRLVGVDRYDTTCYHWSRGASELNATTRVLVGRQLPVASEESTRTVPLVTATGAQGGTADAAYLPRSTGRFVRVTGTDPASPLREALFWISDSGVRYGIEVAPSGGSDPTLTALALRNPVPAPWSVVSLFAAGPTLSQRDARVQHDALPVDTAATALPGG
ncbi:type VII secretion protein EccB [Nocardia yamanashiensis]|uniref:type VII secretion protein EccB n=1 Tax=Nocardia yamanashiensis TaxID=209247 RepID=UPI000A8E7733|nr:type VII secretion protein EccB [Nocardia yamanashiensis]